MYCRIKCVYACKVFSVCVNYVFSGRVPIKWLNLTLGLVILTDHLCWVSFPLTLHLDLFWSSFSQPFLHFSEKYLQPPDAVAQSRPYEAGTLRLTKRHRCLIILHSSSSSVWSFHSSTSVLPDSWHLCQRELYESVPTSFREGIEYYFKTDIVSGNSECFHEVQSSLQEGYQGSCFSFKGIKKGYVVILTVALNYI